MGAIAGLDRFLACVFVSKYLSFVWLPARSIVSHNVGVFAIDLDEFFTVVQSRVHQCFASELSSGFLLKIDLATGRPTDSCHFRSPQLAWKYHFEGPGC